MSRFDIVVVNSNDDSFRDMSSTDGTSHVCHIGVSSNYDIGSYKLSDVNASDAGRAGNPMLIDQGL